MNKMIVNCLCSVTSHFFFVDLLDIGVGRTTEHTSVCYQVSVMSLCQNTIDTFLTAFEKEER